MATRRRSRKRGIGPSQHVVEADLVGELPALHLVVGPSAETALGPAESDRQVRRQSGGHAWLSRLDRASFLERSGDAKLNRDCVTRVLHSASVARRFFIAAIIAIALGAPIVELLDTWDQSLQTGSDTEANVAVVALCVGVAFAIGTIVIAGRIRALSSTSAGRVVMTRVAVRDVASVLAPVPTVSPPTILRV